MRSLLLLAAASLAACANKVNVVPSGSGLDLPSRPADCAVEFFRARPPERPFDEVATLVFERGADRNPTLDQAQEALRVKACAAGADAILVTRDYLLGSMVGVAISYRDLREQHRVDAALRDAAKVAWEGDLEAARKRAGAPARYVPAKMAVAAMVRAAPSRQAGVAEDVPAGTEVWVDPAPASGWRRIWISRERAGYVEADTVRLSAPPAQKAPASGEGAPSRSSI